MKVTGAPAPEVVDEVELALSELFELSKGAKDPFAEAMKQAEINPEGLNNSILLELSNPCFNGK